MTIARERSRSLQHARAFLRELLVAKRSPRVPKYIREEARWCLRHFPSDLDINRVARMYVGLLDKPFEIFDRVEYGEYAEYEIPNQVSVARRKNRKPSKKKK